MPESNQTTRYSDAMLAEFKELVENKIARTKEQLERLQNEILETTENTSDEHGGDWVDDSSINSDIEMLNNMAIRQRKHLIDLENAMLRIRNKTYGICVLTGELIDPKRLRAVPTTTKSLAAKNDQKQQESDRKRFRLGGKPYVKPKGEKKIITKVIRKKKEDEEAPKKPADIEEDDDLLIDDLSIDDNDLDLDLGDDEDGDDNFDGLDDFDEDED
jgi:RNA polymerase-binding transcription factor DksA